jgi:hypothetical protein
MQPSTYRNVPLWISRGRTLSVAQLSDQLLLIGLRKTLESAIDRSESARSESARSAENNNKQYSPLLARAARYSSKDLWVVATALPDPLASLFVPIDKDTKNFEGSVSVHDGLHLEASVDAPSEDAAAVIGEALRGSIASLPSVARELRIEVEAQRVALALEVTPQQLVAGVWQSSSQAAGQPAGQAAGQPVAPAPAEPLPVPSPRAEPPLAEAPDTPMIIRIFGLEEGPREIVLSPPKSHQL